LNLKSRGLLLGQAYPGVERKKIVSRYLINEDMRMRLEHMDISYLVFVFGCCGVMR